MKPIRVLSVKMNTTKGAIIAVTIELAASFHLCAHFLFKRSLVPKA